MPVIHGVRRGRTNTYDIFLVGNTRRQTAIRAQYIIPVITKKQIINEQYNTISAEPSDVPATYAYTRVDTL